MITLQHTALALMAIADLNSRSKTLVAAGEVWTRNGEESVARAKTMESFRNQIPWILLPDAIRMYVGPKQPSHFEDLPDGTDTAWMKFPTGDELAVYKKDALQEGVNFYISPNTPKCVIGENSNLEEFDIRNYDHPQYHQLRTHLLQDCVLDAVLRDDLVDVKDRFEDRFIVRHNRSLKLNGAELRQQIARFEQIGFLHLAGKVAKKCGIILNQEWFEENVHKVLLKSDYPEELAENTYKFMKIPDEINQRIGDLNFDLTDEDKEKILLTDNLNRVLDSLYARAYKETIRELVL